MMTSFKCIVFLVFVLRSTSDCTPFNISVQSRKVIELDPRTILPLVDSKAGRSLGEGVQEMVVRRGNLLARP